MRDLNGNVLSSLATQFDSDAAAFITVANITSTTEITAINNLAKELKRNNIWDKMQAIYPFVGGTATSNRFNLKDQRDSDAAFRLAFSGSWTYSTTGVRMSTSANTNYIRTFYFPSANTTSNSVHISMYFNGSVAGQACLIGAVVNTGAVQTTDPAIQIFVSNLTNISTTQARNVSDSISIPNLSGFHLGNRSASNAMQYYYNGNLSGSNASTSSSLTGFSSDILLLNRGGDRAYYHAGEARFATIGRSLTSGENSALYNIIQAFQTTLGRQVGTSATTIPRIESTIPTRLFGPRELYGSSLITHFDTTDYKNYSLTTLTYIPIPQTGVTVVGAMFDISPQRRRYNFSTSLGSITEANNSWIVLSGTSGGIAINQFSGSSFDTNKGTLGVGSAFFSSLIELYTPYSGSNNIAPNSGVTLGFYTYLNQNLTNHFGIGPNRNCAGNSYPNFGFTYTSATGANQIAAFYGRTGTTNNNIRISNNKDLTPYLYSYRMFLFTITAYTYYWYIDNVLFDSGTIGVGGVSPDSFYPFTGVAGNGNYLSIEGRIQGDTNTAEGFIASEYTPPEQVNMLHNYFIVKFKNKRGSLTDRFK